MYPHVKKKTRTVLVSLILGLAQAHAQVDAAPEAKNNTHAVGAQVKSSELTWLTDFEAAKQLAVKENRPILLFFTGSDWCIYCNVLKKEVYATEAFKNGVKNKWVLVELDLPRDKSIIDAKTLEQNKLLQGYFEITAFPSALVLTPHGKPMAKIPRTSSPESYLKNLEPFTEKQVAFTKLINDATEQEGEAKANTLVKALDLIDKRQVPFHTKTLATLRELDAKGEADTAKSILAMITKRKDDIEEDARKRTLDLESDFAIKGRSGWMTNLDAAKEKAAKEGKFLFIHFTNSQNGSAKVMLNTVFYQPEFKAKTEKDWVLLEIERPVNTNVDPEADTTGSPERAKVWNSYGASSNNTGTVCTFPDGRPFSFNYLWQFKPLSLDDFLDYLEKKKREGVRFQKQLELAKEKKGEERAVILSDLLSPYFKQLLDRPTDFRKMYAPELELLFQADPEFKQKCTKLVALVDISKVISHNSRREKYNRSYEWFLKRKYSKEERAIHMKHYLERSAKISVKTPLTPKELSNTWIKKAALGTRYLKEHDTADLSPLRSMIYYAQAMSYAYQGEKAKSDELLRLITSRELSSIGGRHQRFNSERGVKAARLELDKALNISKKN